MSFVCCHCGRDFKRESAFSKHKLLCELRSGPRDDKTMSVQELTTVIHSLIKKQHDMQCRIDKMQKQIGSRERFSIPKVLALSHKPEIGFLEWSNTITFSQNALESIFDKSYVDGLSTCFEEASNSDRIAPVASTSNGTSKLYIYEADIWKPIDSQMLTSLTQLVMRKVIGAFGNWQSELGDKIYDDSVSRIYHKNVQRIMGASLKVELLSGKIKGLLMRHFVVELNGF